MKRLNSKNIIGILFALIGRPRYSVIDPTISFDNPAEIGFDHDEEKQRIRNDGKEKEEKQNKFNNNMKNNQRVVNYKSEKRISISKQEQLQQQLQQQSQKRASKSKIDLESVLKNNSTATTTTTGIEARRTVESINKKNINSHQKQNVTFSEVYFITILLQFYYDFNFMFNFILQRKYEENFQIQIFIFFKKDFLFRMKIPILMKRNLLK